MGERMHARGRTRVGTGIGTRLALLAMALTVVTPVAAATATTATTADGTGDAAAATAAGVGAAPAPLPGNAVGGGTNALQDARDAGLISDPNGIHEDAATAAGLSAFSTSSSSDDGDVEASSTCPAPGGAGTPLPNPAPTLDFIFGGRGWGHGLGMSQWGSQGAAKLGCDAETIVETYYPGTEVTPLPEGATPPSLIIGLRPKTRTTTSIKPLDSDEPLIQEVKWVHCHEVDGNCTVVATQPVGTTWKVTTDRNGAYTVTGEDGNPAPALDGTTLAGVGHSQTVLRVQHDGATVLVPEAGRRSRWGYVQFDSVGESAAGAGNHGVYVTQVFEAKEPDPNDPNANPGGSIGAAIDRYLWGLAEVPASWPEAALDAQAIAARSYAYTRWLAGKKSDCRCHLLPDIRDQHWTGWLHELQDRRMGARWKQAVDRTTNLVVAVAGDPAQVATGYYSSSNGGHTDDVRFIWGGSGSYLRPVDDSNWAKASDDPRLTWTKSFPPGELGRLLGVGFALSATVTEPKSPVGRVGNPSRGQGGLRVIGTQGSVTVSGDFARSRLKLNSVWFRVVEPVAGEAPGIALAGDWDGDGDGDAGWYADGAVTIQVEGQDPIRFHYGREGDIPIVGDWNGDGKDTLGIVRAGGEWHLKNSLKGGSADLAFTYGRVGTRGDDVPLVGDWDGDGVDTVGIVRHGEWHLRQTLSGGPAHIRFTYGRVGPRGDDIPAIGDWDGDGKDSVGIIRNGEWHLRNDLSAGPGQIQFTYGDVGPDGEHQAVIADWNADGKDDPGITRGPAWYLRYSLSGGEADEAFVFGG